MDEWLSVLGAAAVCAEEMGRVHGAAFISGKCQQLPYHGLFGSNPLGAHNVLLQSGKGRAETMWFPLTNVVHSGRLISNDLSGHESDSFLTLRAQVLRNRPQNLVSSGKGISRQLSDF